MKKKTFSILFAALLTVLLMPTMVFAESNWSQLSKAMNGEAQGTVEDVFTVEDNTPEAGTRTITLLADITAGESDSALNLSGNKVILDLNGHVIDRNIHSSSPYDRPSAINFDNEAYLTIKDGNPDSDHAGYYDNEGLWHWDKNGTYSLQPGETNHVIKGGVITGACSENRYGENPRGGGICILGNGNSLEMLGGTIAGNKKNGYGGGIYVAGENNNFIMKNGTIEGNVSYDSWNFHASGGGGVCFSGGNFTMSGGRIVNNIVKDAGRGGGVSFYNNGVTNATFVMTGGCIENNSAISSNSINSYAGGVYVPVDATFVVGGTAVIRGNRTIGGSESIEESNVHLQRMYESAGVTISTETPLSTDAEIGLTVYDGNESSWGPGKPVSSYFVSGLTEENMKCFFMNDCATYKYQGIKYNIEKQESDFVLSGTYKVTINAGANGTVTSDKTYYVGGESGDTVTFTVSPDKGFKLDTITVIDENDKKVEVKDLGDNKFSFQMPEAKVSVSVTFIKDGKKNLFVDVKESDYFYDAVIWAAENGITTGTDDTHFSPLIGTSRAEAVTFLWRTAGSPEPKGNASKFVDVKAGTYYAKAVAWALEQGVTKGTSATTFSPNVICTRAQIVTLIARYEGVKDTDTKSEFDDVKSSDYFAAAVKWAKDNKVTMGTSDTKFSPNVDCTRSQIVTFIYRWMVK